MEEFAFVQDRETFLRTLMPATEDYYYYHCLHYQHEGRLEEVDKLLSTWRARIGQSQRWDEIDHRQALLVYDKDPARTLEHVRKTLGLRFNHQRKAAGRHQGRRSSRLDQKLVSREALEARALKKSHKDRLDGFTDRGLEQLLDQGLEGKRLRALLNRLTRPDHPRLVELVVKDLRSKDSKGFGSLGIHERLLRDQMGELGNKLKRLWKDEKFVLAYLKRLQPNADLDPDEPAVRAAHLGRLRSAVDKLTPAFNSLKAHVLYHVLDHARREGRLDLETFEQYVKLPRNVAYVRPDYLREKDVRDDVFAMGGNFRRTTHLVPVTDDEPLVREHLTVVFREAKDFKKYERYLRGSYLKSVFAETKILSGIGDMERWYSMLDDPARYAAIRDRVEVELALSNPRRFRAGDEVALEVDVKNVETLVVKVFRVNALNYFLATGHEVDTSIDLDGLVAAEELTFEYSEPPHRRHRRRFELTALAKPGTYVVEMIGGGMSSRALVHKGSLGFLERHTAAGHVFTILDEDGRALDNATLWLAGREHTPDSDSKIRIPYSTRPRQQPILLQHGDTTKLESFKHRAEVYRLSAGIYVDRESLVKRREARVVVRPRLLVNDAPVALSLLEEATLVIHSTDAEGVSSTLEAANLELKEDEEYVHAFQVPEDLRSLVFTLRGKVKSLSRGADIKLSDSRDLALNDVDATEQIQGPHLARTRDGYVLHVLGKTGEARDGSEVTVTLSHPDYAQPLYVTLCSDEDGRIELGPLAGFDSLDVALDAGVSQSWTLASERCRYPRSIHARAEETVRIPAPDLRDASRSELSLLEVRRGTFVKDRLDAARLENGCLELHGLPAGDYDLLLKRRQVAVSVRLSDGDDVAGWIVSGRRCLESRHRHPLHFTALDMDRNELTIRLGNASRFTRVHVFATRFLPVRSAFDELARVPVAEPRTVSIFRAWSHYVSGRDIGEEYRYVLERRRQAKLPGNMLKRPGVLLNPWAVRDTETDTRQAAEGGKHSPSVSSKLRSESAAAAEPSPDAGRSDRFANLDFLAAPATVLVNLEPDGDGVVRVPRGEIGPANQVRVVAVDPVHTICRDLPLPEDETPHEDLRLDLALDPEHHYIERKQVTALEQGDALEVADVTSAQLETYDTVAKLHGLLSTLSGDETLAKFAFVTHWPSLSREEKQEKYSIFACHELSFFLSRRDLEFFSRVVRPYLANKKDKTFLDDYLLDNDLNEYRKPWAWGRLNVVERILLSRWADEAEGGRRHVRELWELLPRDVEHENRLFQAGLRSGALDTVDELGVEEVKEEIRQQHLAKKRQQSAKPMRRARAKLGNNMDRDGVVAAAVAMPALRGGGPEQDWDAYEAELEDDAATRGETRAFYRKVDKTREWAENNYYHRPIEEQVYDLVSVNAFWCDYAEHDGSTPFLSPNVAHASRNFTEMMFALSIVELPFDAKKPKVGFDGSKMRLEAGSRALVFHQEVKPALPAEHAGTLPILVSQNYFRDDDRYRYEDGEQLDKYVEGEWLVHTVYVCQVVLTNPTSATQKLDLLLQIPLGSMPVRNGFRTRGRQVQLKSYATTTVEYAFYFPAPGEYDHYPVQVSKNEELVAAAEPTKLTVVLEPSRVDETSWAWLSQNGEEPQVLRYLEEHNVERPDLEGFAWRMSGESFYKELLALLRQRHVYNDTLWSYSVHHDDPAGLREYLAHQDAFLDRCGLYLVSPLVTIDPVSRHRYQHLEYAPLVNARAHRLGAEHKVLNKRLSGQYAELLRLLCYHERPSHDDLLAAAYYLFLQDRVEEALETFDRVDPAKIETGLQYDYLHVYALFYREDPARARETALRHEDHPVDRWRHLFREALAQLDEMAGGASEVTDASDRDQQQAKLAATEASFELAVERKSATRTIVLTYRNLTSCRVSYYRMDVELLFSRQPFLQQQSDQFSFIQPNRSEVVDLPADGHEFRFDLPEALQGTNVVVEVAASGRRRSLACYAHELRVQVAESYGQLRVSASGDTPDSDVPTARVYVKVYARMKDGETRFYKDGYTDLRGRFDFASLSTSEMDDVDRFALLVLSEEKGAVIREATPPKQ